VCAAENKVESNMSKKIRTVGMAISIPEDLRDKLREEAEGISGIRSRSKIVVRYIRIGMGLDEEFKRDKQMLREALKVLISPVKST